MRNRRGIAMMTQIVPSVPSCPHANTRAIDRFVGLDINNALAMTGLHNMRTPAARFARRVC